MQLKCLCQVTAWLYIAYMTIISTRADFSVKLQNNKKCYCNMPVLLHTIVTGIVDNPNGTIVIENKPPTTWNGRKFDVGVFKDGKLLVTQSEVHIGDQVDFMLQPKLFFAVCRNLQVGDVFTSLEITSCMTEFDLSNFPHGMEVTLSEAAGGGKYSFSAQNKVV